MSDPWNELRDSYDSVMDALDNTSDPVGSEDFNLARRDFQKATRGVKGGDYSAQLSERIARMEQSRGSVPEAPVEWAESADKAIKIAKDLVQSIFPRHAYQAN